MPNIKVISVASKDVFIDIHKGEKFAQLVLAEVPKANFYLVDKVMEDTERADGGFGSTGLK